VSCQTRLLSTRFIPASTNENDPEHLMISEETVDHLSLSLRTYLPEESITQVSPESFKLVSLHPANSTSIESVEPVEVASLVDEVIWYYYL
jgi:hypothetical protein